MKYNLECIWCLFAIWNVFMFTVYTNLWVFYLQLLAISRKNGLVRYSLELRHGVNAPYFLISSLLFWVFSLICALRYTTSGLFFEPQVEFLNPLNGDALATTKVDESDSLNGALKDDQIVGLHLFRTKKIELSSR